MALQSFVSLWLFLLLVSAAMARPSVTITLPISDFDNGEVQFLGKFAVEQYNKEGGSHLYFIEVVNGTVDTIYYFQPNENGTIPPLPPGNNDYPKTWKLELKAHNCSQPGHEPGLYAAQVFESFSSGQINAYGSSFMASGIITKL